MAFKYRKLRGKIVEKYGTMGEFSKVLGISDVSLSRKMNGIVAFSHNDIVKWCGLLDIEQSEIGEYFFS